MRRLPARLGLDRPIAQWLLLAASLLVVVLGVRTIIVAHRLQREVEQLRTANQDLQDREASRQGQIGGSQPRDRQATKPAERERSASFALSLGLPGGVGPPTRLILPEDTEIVRLQLDLPAGSTYERFRVGLRGAPGDEFWSQGRLQPENGGQGPALRLMLPGPALAPGGGFVFNAIHNVQAGTPIENIVAMVNAVREFNGER